MMSAQREAKGQSQSLDQAKLVKSLSKRLSWLLRHGALREGIFMDSAGWVSISDVCAHLKIHTEQLELVIKENNKARFQKSGDLIRATQGHSLDQMSVTQEGLESSWSTYDAESEDPIWHATQARHLDSILQEGIMRGERTHVHLASAIDSHVGKRSNAPILLGVSVESLRAHGHEVFISPNGVVLTRYVPVSCIITVQDTRSQRAKARAMKRDQA